MSNATLPADFLDAMNRHWQDAELLCSKERLANSDHLYGLSAECGLKALMEKFGMKMEKNMPPSDDRKHINNGLYDRYETYREGANATRFQLPWQDSHFPFENWEVDDRYANRGHFVEDRLKKHRSGAEDVKKLVDKAEKEGLLP